MIDGLHRLAGALAALTGTALIHGTILAIVAAALAATLLRRARPAVLAALWLVVLCKFLLPIGPGARFSLASLYDRATAEPTPAAVLAFAPPTAGPAVAPTAPPPPRHPIALALMTAWAAIALGLAARELRRYRRARRQAQALTAAPAWLAAEVAALAPQVGARTRVDVKVGGVASPYVIGVTRPVVVVPAALLTDRPRLLAALAHELAHVRRVDGAVRVVQRIAACLFFFWPVVRWVNRRLDLAREQACDAYAIAHGPLDATAYARLLITVARQQAPAAALGLGGSQLARRVHALARPRPTGVGAAGAVAVLAFAAVGLTGARAARAERGAVGERVCVFTPQLAAEILVSYPEADIDGDGALSRTEVCDFQLAMRRRYVNTTFAELPFDADVRERLASTMPMRALPAGVIDGASPLASDQLCCNCSAPGSEAVPGQPAEFNPAITTCTRGVDP
ncbi:MAG: M56 family metallopeptidase [Myxococcales bacterium]|nr:M56 family metallopeptidase [Myxococcales bacterium]